MNFFTQKARTFIGLFLFLSLSLTAHAAFVAPQFSGHVNDYAGLLSATQRNALEQRLAAYKKETSTEIAVVIANDFQGLDAFTYSQKLFDSWKVGTADKDNGIIIAIGPKLGQSFPEHGDIFINNGKGIEGALPDILTGRIIRNDMVPLFKKGDFYGAISAGLTSIELALKGEYTAAGDDADIGSANKMVNFVWYMGMFFLFFSSYFASFLARSKSWYAGGILGGLGGFFFGYFFFAIGFALAASAFFAIVGFILDYFLSKTYQTRLAKGLPTDFWHTRGGFWGSGRGGFGGGGFGGFSGGSSGGGGAGGGW